MINDNLRKILSECSQQMVKYSHLQSTLLKSISTISSALPGKEMQIKHRKTMNEIK